LTLALITTAIGLVGVAWDYIATHIFYPLCSDIFPAYRSTFPDFLIGHQK